MCGLLTLAGDFMLQDKVVVVTGASGALGKFVVEAALARGARVAAIDYAAAQAARSPRRLELGGIDLTDAAQAKTAIDAAAAHFGKLDALVNIAGGFAFETVADGDPKTWARMYALNVTTALADDLNSANFGKLDVDDLFKAAIFKIDSKFMREMKDSGYPNLGMEELVKARIFKIDGEYLRHLAQIGFTNEPFESVVKMKIFKVTPEFINEIRAEGLQKLDIEDLVKMRIFKIDAAFIRQARSEGVPLEVEKLVQKRIGVYGK